jgi:r-opsin
VTLSAIACERYIVITSSSCRPVVAKWRITRRQAQRVKFLFFCYIIRV